MPLCRRSALPKRIRRVCGFRTSSTSGASTRSTLRGNALGRRWTITLSAAVRSPGMETLLQDVRVTLRTFRRSPGFPLTAIATLALGIGATTAIFTTLSAVLLKPLPYRNPQDLYSLRTALTDGRVTTGLLSGGEIYRLNDRKLSIARAAGLQSGDLTLLAADGTPSHVQGYFVTEGFFELFGLPMTMGGFSHDDLKVLPPPQPNAPPQPRPPPAVVISTRRWKQ